MTSPSVGTVSDQISPSDSSTSSTRPVSVSGEQYVLTTEDDGVGLEAVITQRAAALRVFSAAGQHYFEPYDEDTVSPLGDGLILVPWPNRIAQGRWNLDEQVQQLDITEPKTGNAIHGLLRNTAYTVTDQGDDFVELQATVFPQHGYPFLLDTSVRYELVPQHQDDSAPWGLVVTHTVSYRGEGRAPVAIGAHPYVRVAEEPTSDLILKTSAESVYVTDERKIPTEKIPVSGQYDLRDGRQVGQLSLDHGFGDLSLAESGRYEHVLEAQNGETVTVWGDHNFAYVQIFTPDNFPTGVGKAVAIEPMTAPADAFNTGEGLTWLENGQVWVAQWGIQPGQ